MDKSVNTMLIQLNNLKAIEVLNALESLNLITIIKGNKDSVKPTKSDEPEAKPKLSTKYKGIISKEEGQKLNDHINQMRSEWNNN